MMCNYHHCPTCWNWAEQSGIPIQRLDALDGENFVGNLFLKNLSTAKFYNPAVNQVLIKTANDVYITCTFLASTTLLKTIQSLFDLHSIGKLSSSKTRKTDVITTKKDVVDDLSSAIACVDNNTN